MNKKQLKEAFENKLIDEDTYKNELFKIEQAPKVRKPQKILDSPTEEEFIKMLKAYTSKNPRKMSAKIAFLLAYGSGLRIGEIIHLFPEDIEDKQIKIRYKENWHPKYGKERIVPLPKGWKEEFKKYLPINKTVRTLERQFKTALRQAGIEENKYHFHQLRASFCRRCIEKGIPINQVQLLMGHSNLATTSFYSKARTEDAIKSYEEYF